MTCDGKCQVHNNNIVCQFVIQSVTSNLMDGSTQNLSSIMLTPVNNMQGTFFRSIYKSKQANIVMYFRQFIIIPSCHCTHILSILSFTNFQAEDEKTHSKIVFGVLQHSCLLDMNKYYKLHAIKTKTTAAACPTSSPIIITQH